MLNYNAHLICIFGEQISAVKQPQQDGWVQDVGTFYTKVGGVPWRLMTTIRTTFNLFSDYFDLFGCCFLMFL